MTIDRLHTYLLSLSGAIEDRPFGPDIPVYKVMGKMFAYVSPNQTPPWLTLKLDPILGQMLRSTYAAVHASYHMNKEHWNTIVLDGSMPDEEIMAWVDDSYELVVAGLPRKKREQLQPMPEKGS
ncbi:MAG: MmcQ/YjbR family DNA-binding protein [Candidatus Bipolaricaulia bacterium]